MNTREYFELFRYLMEQQCMLSEDIVFVGNISDWCRDHGVPEPDRNKPLKLIVKDGQGCKMLVKEDLPDSLLEERIRAVRIRNQIISVASSKADMLDTPQRQLAFLFLNEYAYSLPEVEDDLLADRWAFEQMERLGYFKT